MHNEAVKPLFIAVSGFVASFTLGNFTDMTDTLLVVGRFITAIAMIMGSVVAIYRLFNTKENTKINVNNNSNPNDGE